MGGLPNMSTFYCLPGRVGGTPFGLAAQEFRLIIDRPYAYGIGPGIATAHLGLARALEIQGIHAAASQQYKSFFTLWKDADPDIPVLRQAHREYARIQ